MIYPILSLCGESTAEAAAKLRFALATARAKKEGFLRVDFLCGAEGRVRLRGAVTRVLRERKRNGRVLFFILSEDFLSTKPEAEFIANKFPSLLEDADLLNPESGYILVKL